MVEMLLTMTSFDGDPPGDQISSIFTLNSSAVYGCTDPNALNYNADATDDDGSCYFTGDVCDAPEVVTDIWAGVVDGTAEFYSVSIPSTSGALNIFSTGTSGYVSIYSSCDAQNSDFSNDYEGWVAYFYVSSTGVIATLDFSAAGLDYNGNPTDSYLGTECNSKKFNW